MDWLSLLRTLGGLGVVLGLLAGALWLVRRFDLRLPGRIVAARERRLELIETLPLDARRMVALLRRDGREHLFLIAPEGHLVLESGLIRDAVDHAADDARRAARDAAARAKPRQQAVTPVGAPPESFADLIDQVRAGAVPAALAMKAALDRAVTVPRATAVPRGTPLAIRTPRRRSVRRDSADA